MPDPAERHVSIDLPDVTLQSDLVVPEASVGLVALAHRSGVAGSARGTGSSRALSTSAGWRAYGSTTAFRRNRE